MTYSSGSSKEDRLDLSSIPHVKDDRLRLFERLMSNAIKCSEDENKRFKLNAKYVLDNALTDEDKNALRMDSRPTLNFPILKPYLMRTLKNIVDSAPTLDVRPAKDDSTDLIYGLPAVQISSILTQTMEEILEQNHYKNVLFNVSFDCAVGGKGIFKIKTRYKNQYDFEQEYVLEHVHDPTMVFFDPRARDLTKKDGEFSGELIYLTREEFEKNYPSVSWQLIKEQKRSYNESQFYSYKWYDESNNVAIISDFYYKKHSKKTLYILNNGEKTYDKLTEEMKSMGLRVDRKRSINFTEIWHTQFCGKIELKKPSLTNFHHLIHVMCPSEILWENNKQVQIPFVQPAIDAQRTKNFLTNFFLFDALNHDKGKLFMPMESLPDQSMNNARSTTDENIIYYHQYKSNPQNANEPLPVNPPHYIAPPPIDQAPMEAAQVISKDVEKILGAQMPSADEVNLSGKALYNMADFMSASNEIFVQHLLLSWQHVGTVILDSMPNVLPPRKIGMVPPGEDPNNKNANVAQQFTYDYRFPRGFYYVSITRGVNYKLQQQKNVEIMLEYCKLYPPFAQFLFTDGFSFMIENMDFNNKSKLEEAYENYQKKMEMQAQQSGAQQMQQMAMQEKQEQLQNQRMNAQSQLMRAQTDQQRLQIQAQELQHQQRESQNDMMVEFEKLNSSERRNLLDNLVKIEHIKSIEKKDQRRPYEESTQKN